MRLYDRSGAVSITTLGIFFRKKFVTSSLVRKSQLSLFVCLAVFSYFRFWNRTGGGRTGAHACAGVTAEELRIVVDCYSKAFAFLKLFITLAFFVLPLSFGAALSMLRGGGGRWIWEGTHCGK